MQGAKYLPYSLKFPKGRQIQMKYFPMIGIAGSINKDEDTQSIARAYMRAVRNSSAIPVLLSYDMEGEALEGCLDRLDGILLAGGNDVDPALYGEAGNQMLGEVNPPRDEFETRLLQAAVQRKMPILGICRGIQILNVSLGGSLWQDLPSQFRTSDGNQPILHSQTARGYHRTHGVTAVEGTMLHAIEKDLQFRVNSFHHQAVKQPAPGMRVSAHAEDGVIEAIEHENLPFCMGVQWHPELFFDRDVHSSALFDAFAAAAACYRESLADK